MPVASLPNRIGSGDFGPDAFRFVDEIADAGFSIWQILPLAPLGYGNSPYQPYSSYAIDELYISLDLLEEQGMIGHVNDYRRNSKTIDYEKVRRYREAVLRNAFQAFQPDSRYQNFLKEQRWLESYVVYRAFKQANGLRAWDTWPKKQRNYPIDGDVDLAPYEEEIRYQKFLQYILYYQWADLKSYANSKGIRIMGDIPFYVGHDSADCWNARANFLLKKDGKPRFIAGVPPDYFAATGQRWGNPIYDWDYMKNDEFGFWMDRIGFSMKMFDIIRLDHFRAFDTYWKIPASCPTAMEGEWIEAPGISVFDHLLELYPNIRIVAEDLGDLRPEVLELRDRFNFPGMHVFQFEFSPDIENRMQPHSVLYTGTHDNEPLKVWYGKKTPAEKRRIRKWFADRGYKGADIFEKIQSFVLQSEPEIVIIPMSDLIKAGEIGVLNRPGTVGSPNWEWRMPSLEAFEKYLPAVRQRVLESGRK